jgi:hypothetical protein
MKFNFYSDPGHGWVRVHKSLLNKLGIENLISPYSYMRGDYAYLEEDCDLGVLIKALEARFIPFAFNESHTNKNSKIRSYESYRTT